MRSHRIWTGDGAPSLKHARVVGTTRVLLLHAELDRAALLTRGSSCDAVTGESGELENHIERRGHGESREGRL